MSSIHALNWWFSQMFDSFQLSISKLTPNLSKFWLGKTSDLLIVLRENHPKPSMFSSAEFSSLKLSFTF